MVKSRSITALTLVVLAWALPSWAEERRHGAHLGNLPIEVGQGAFAALSEIVEILEAAPDTDWTTVDLSALREHLVDMDVLMLDADVTEKPRDDGLSMTVTGKGRTLQAIHHMVPAHAAELDKMPVWSVSTEMIADGAILTVTSPDEAIQARISGLGFFGLMATGSHHQAHHLAIARGKSMHGHH